MLTSRLPVLLFVSAILCHADVFRLTRLIVTTQTPQDGRIFVATTGDAPSNLAESSLWTLSVHDKAKKSDTALPVSSVVWDASTRRVALTFPAAQLAGRNVPKLDWTATFNNTVQATSKAPKSGKFLSPAEGKNEADIYLFGSYLAGFSTKPIYSIDAKVNWVPEIRESGYFFGMESSLLTNSGAVGPVDRTRVDPDSISAALALKHRFHQLSLDLKPLRGEFSRAYPASNITTAGALRWVGHPLFQRGRTAAVLYPFAGYEAGGNLNKPRMLFGQNVDLSRYNTIGRAVVGAHAALLFFQKTISPEDPYRLVIQSDYSARVPFAAEPFVTSEYIDGQRTAVTRVRTNTRHYLESGIIYNVSDLFGVEAKYKFGSLPPLFEFVDHQVTLGLTFKAKLPRTPR